MPAFVITGLPDCIASIILLGLFDLISIASSGDLIIIGKKIDKGYYSDKPP